MKTPELRRQAYVEIPARALTFLRGLAANPDIRKRMAQNGYTAVDHGEGLSLLRALLEVSTDDPTWRATETRSWNDDAMEFSRTKLRALETVLRRRHPAAHAHVFGGRTIESNVLLEVALVMDRLEQLEPTSAALDDLARMGITPELRARLRVQDRAWTTPVAATPARDERALHALRDWHRAWAHVAHDVLPSREDRIRLGLVRRRRNAAVDADAADTLAADDSLAATPRDVMRDRQGCTSSCALP